MNTVAIVGTVNLDAIVTENGHRTESLGGILYNAVSLGALLEGTRFRVLPVARLGQEHVAAAERLLRFFPAVDPGGLIVDPGGTNRSRLDYSRATDRREEVEMNVGPLTAADLEGARGAQAVLVNMISGQDVARTTLASLRHDSEGLFLLDIQALARTLDRPRAPREVPDWDQWCSGFDIVRGNEEEITWFAGAPGEVRFAMERILEAGAGEVLVTRGEQGSLRGVREAGRPLHIDEIPAYPRPSAGDLTGCGDSYLSGVCAGHLLGLSPLESAHLGSWTAAQVAAIVGLDAMIRLRGLRARAAGANPAFSRLAPPAQGAAPRED